MSILRIALRSIQYRGLGSWLTIFSMALGVMLVVAVLTMHGVVSQQFKSNSSFGYDLILGASGSAMQVTMNTVYYLSSPVENIPYEYYLELKNKETRGRELRNSISYQSMLSRDEAAELSMQLTAAAVPFGGALSLATRSTQQVADHLHTQRMGIDRSGTLENWVDMAIPVNLGDYLGSFRVVGTKPEFFTQLYLDIDTEETLQFAAGRAFEENSNEHGFFEAVLGSKVARDMDLKVGDVINPIHGDPASAGAHTHEQGFTIVGVLERSGTPHDRAVFVNLEGFYLMEDHAKPVDESSPFGIVQPMQDIRPASWTISGYRWQEKINAHLGRTRLPIEQREVTAILVRSYASDPEEEEDDFAADIGGMQIENTVNEGYLEKALNWTDFRPAQAKEEVQAVRPVEEVTKLFAYFVDPIRWVLLALTVMICFVSGISILVGIYNSMAQRKHEIAVMRALGASRSKVMAITLLESVTLALAGGIFGWVAGHGLNAAVSPLIEAQTGVSIGFWDFAPAIPIAEYLGSVSNLPVDAVEWLRISPELFLIPGLVALAVLVGLYPAISAYRTDVAQSLG